MDVPIIKKKIPDQTMNEGTSYGPFDFKKYIGTKGKTTLQFEVKQTDGAPLPKGLICTEDGILTGIPASETEGVYEIVVIAKNALDKVETTFNLTVKPSLLIQGAQYFDQLKAQVWEAINKNLTIPELKELLHRPVTPLDIYHLLERWGTLIIWNASNLDAPSDKKVLTLVGASEHYIVYDQGSRLIATPVDLFSSDRTTADGLKTVQAMAREVHRREWTIELVGYDKWVKAVWVEIQHLNDKMGKKLEIINYTPTLAEMKIYTSQAIETERKSLTRE
jgi:hypothetical protein